MAKKKEAEKCECREDKSPFVAVPASLGGIYLVIVLFFLLFAKESLEYLVPIAWAFVVMCVGGVAFAYWSTKAGKK